MKLVTSLTILVIMFFGIGQTALSKDKLSPEQLRARNVICKVFGPYCEEAKNITWCESKWRVWASNGQYLGLFQMGSSERATYGHGPGAWAQARAAWRYFVASGKDWSPWTCRYAK